MRAKSRKIERMLRTADQKTRQELLSELARRAPRDPVARAALRAQTDNAAPRAVVTAEEATDSPRAE